MKSNRCIKEIGRDLIGFWLLATGAVCLALLLNELRDHPLPLIYASKKQRLENAVAQVATAESAPVVPAADHPQVISLQGFRELAEGKKGVVLDARPEIFHRLGHVPGAISLSREDFEKDYAKNKSLLESNKDQAIAVYCSGADCEDSDMVANALVKLAYHRVLVFKGGWNEWSGAGLPQEGKQ